MPLVSVVIPSRNNFPWLSRCLSSLTQQSYQDFEVIVVDNGSTDDSVDRTEHEFPYVQNVRLGSNGFLCKALNTGITTSKGNFVAIINNDTEFAPSWLSSALDTFARNPSVGSVAPKILSLRKPQVIDSAGNYLSINGLAGNRGYQQFDGPEFAEEREVFSPSSAGGIYRKSVLEEIQGFDEELIAYYEDIDVGFRAQLRGYRCRYNPASIMYHYGSSTKESTFKRMRLFERNMIINLIKNMPLAMLQKHWVKIAQASLLPPLCSSPSRKYLPWMIGRLMFLTNLAKTMRKRRSVQSSCRVSIEYIESILEDVTNFHSHL